jgi:hypothetical protein
MAGSLISPRQKAEMKKDADNNIAGSRVVFFMKIFFGKDKEEKGNSKIPGD